jgi:hypothetical protein
MEETMAAELKMGDLKAGGYYRMPLPYGPMPGPRQIPDGKFVDRAAHPKRKNLAVSYLARADQLEALLPPGMALWGEPVVSFEITYLTELDWLAGRGYNTFGVRFPAVCETPEGPVHGTFLSLLWENLADPIISGREELGYSKLYCEIPEPRVHNGRHTVRCGWQGHVFAELELWDLAETTGAAPRNPLNKGTLHYKFSPRTGDWGQADFAGAVLTPVVPGESTVDQRFAGKGRVAFHHAAWEELPTLYHIVNRLAALDLVEFRVASLTFAHGANDHEDQRILREDHLPVTPAAPAHREAVAAK